MKPVLVIVGASYAGTQLAASARELGYEGHIVMLGDELDLPYQRPPLSKGFLTGSVAEARLPLRSAAFFDGGQIDWMPSTRAVRIDRDAREVELHDGRRIAYDKLALTTGARVRKLDCPGAHAQGVHYLRDLRDARALAAALRVAHQAVVIGGGYIGLEAAASLRQRGLDVSVVEAETRLLARVASPLISQFMLDTHAAHGVQCHLGRKVVALHETDGHVSAVELDDGTQLRCDLVLVGIGVVPNAELARDCGLTVEGGIAVDECARTADPDIVAAGDCASFVSAWLPAGAAAGRIESVQNANDMARAAAAALVADPQPYRALPWFWSDQYDLKLQMAGLHTGWTEYALRGALEERKFSLYYFRDNHLVAVDSINRPQDHMLARKLLANRIAVSAQQVADPSFDLKTLLVPNAPHVTP
ncbi:NAD(P)/FAD-dependent oxidoreductase [Paraburkholderia jirisanensis]